MSNEPQTGEYGPDDDAINAQRGGEPIGRGDTPPAPVDIVTVHRDHITDRTGELLQRSVEVATEFARPVVALVSDPLDGTQAPIVITPASSNSSASVEELDDAVFAKYRSAPVRIEGITKIGRIESFIDQVNRFKEPDSAVFADENTDLPRLIAIVDYHGGAAVDYQALHQGDLIHVSPNRPRFQRHRIHYDFPLSDEWQAWGELNGAPMTMADFAEFLEDRIVDVEAIDDVSVLSEQGRKIIAATNGKMAGPTTLLALSQGLKVHESSTIQEARNLSSGEGQVVFRSEHRDENGQPLSVPNIFVITIPVFKGSADVYRIVARLRYRVKGGGIVFWYNLAGVETVMDHAFVEACDKVKAETSLPLFYGTPD